mgnify:CR=1 FL=1
MTPQHFYGIINKKLKTNILAEGEIIDMSEHTITIAKVNELVKNGVTSFSKKDNSPRGCKTVSASELKVGDKIVINNYFTLIVE